MDGQEKKDIKIPIKDIVMQAMTSNDARYEEDEFNLLRRYFIACLNLGYMEPKDLVPMVNKFASKIKFISLMFNRVNKMDYYMVSNGVLYINGALKESNSAFYETNFYKAVTEVIFEANDNHIALSNALCNMTAEKIYTMDTTGSRIVMPKTHEEEINGKKIQIRAGYTNYNLIISLLKQLFICKGINENKLIHDMYFNGYESVIKNIFTDDNTKLLIDVLDKLCIMYIKRIVMKQTDSSEQALLDKYQIIVNDMFTKMDQNYFAFCALITTDELREKCMKKFDLKI